MSSEQCNNCGGFEKLDVCVFCSTVVCEHCKLNHAPLCEELEKRKRRNQGPTVANTPAPQHRRGHEVPPTTGPDRPNWNPNVSKDVQEITQDGDIVWTNMGPAVAPESDVNSGLMGVHDLLKGE